MVVSDLYDRVRLTQTDLRLMYPAGNLYRDDLTLALHLTNSMLVEKMEWEDNTAIGSTAFWLKILSTPSEREYKLQKIKFKRQVFSSWLNRNMTSATKSQFKAEQATATSRVIATPLQGRKPVIAASSSGKRMYEEIDSEEEEDGERQRTLFQVTPPKKRTPTQPGRGRGWGGVVMSCPNVTTPGRKPARIVHTRQASSDHDDIDDEEWEVESDDAVDDGVEDGVDDGVEDGVEDTGLQSAVDSAESTEGTSGLSPEEWAVIEASMQASGIDAVQEKKKPKVIKTTSIRRKVAPPISLLKLGQTPVVQLTRLNVNDGTSPAHLPSADVCEQVSEVKKTKTKVLIQPNASEERLELMRLIPCAHCDFRGVTRAEADEHRFSVHRDIYRLPCEEAGCTYRAKQRWILKRHWVANHCDKKNFKCSECEYKAKTDLEVQRHIKSKHLKLMWNCELCDFQCDITKNTRRNMHMAEKHGDFSKVYRCRTCNFITENRSGLMIHVNHKHSRSVTYQCGYEGCHFSSLIETVVKTHRRLTHEGRPHKAKGYERKQFPTSAKTRKRCYIIHKYYCSECREPYRFKQIMERHIRDGHLGKAQAVPTHAKEPGVMSHTCSECGAKFSNYLDAEAHNKQVHKDTAELTSEYIKDISYTPTYIRCSFCEFSCETWAGMKSHVRNNHENRIYKCDQCPFMTNSKNGLTNHKTINHDSEWVKRKLEKVQAQNKIIENVATTSSSASVSPQPTMNTFTSHGNQPTTSDTGDPSRSNEPITSAESDNGDEPITSAVTGDSNETYTSVVHSTEADETENTQTDITSASLSFNIVDKPPLPEIEYTIT